jgi:hypothetical protein
MTTKITIVIEYGNEADVPRFGANMLATIYDPKSPGFGMMPGKIIAVAFEDVLQEKDAPQDNTNLISEVKALREELEASSNLVERTP